MSDCLTWNANGAITKGMPMDGFRKPCSLTRAAPGVPLNQKAPIPANQPMLYLGLPKGNAAQWRCGDESFALANHSKALMFLEAGQVHRFFESGRSVFTIGVTPSGQVRLLVGDHPQMDIGPQQAQPGDPPELQAAYDWLNRGPLGGSALTACRHLVLRDAGRMDAAPGTDMAPADGSDFQGCLDFFAAVPQARERLPALAGLGPEWAAIAPVWGELEATWASGPEGPTQVWARLRELRTAVHEAQRARRSPGP